MLSSLSAFFSDSGSLDACRNCSGAKCCGNIRHGGTIEPPYLTGKEVERISRATGLSPDIFSDAINNPHTGNTVRMLKTNSKDGCHFLSEGRCTIHDFRPVDCRLFPLDIKKTGNELQWVIYNYHHCAISERDHGLLIEQMNPALAHLGDELLDYATVPAPGMEGVGFTPIGKVAP